MTTASKSLRLADTLAREPFAWPGGYPRYAVTSDGGCLCSSCCKTERDLIGTTTGSDGWNVVWLAINYADKDLACDNCHEEIVASYA
jgi:hypothetical protein